MDEINDFFNFAKNAPPPQRQKIPINHVVPRSNPDEPDQLKHRRIDREQYGKEYAETYKIQEQENLVEAFQRQAATSKSTALRPEYDQKPYELDNIESDDDDDKGAVGGARGGRNHPEYDDVYDKYRFDHSTEVKLPIMSFKDIILRTINKYPVVVIQGATGCGKTTQVPQFIIDEAFKEKKYCNIIVTQPRRIAAYSIANRVAHERKWELGSVVGYQVALHKHIGDDTRILYCTTGILLESLIKSQSMDKYTHIVLDEVHERDQDMDFLLIVVRRLLSTNSRNVKIILMSATIEANKFADYFKMKLPVRETIVPAPIINVDSKRLFSVKEFYLCQLGRLTPTAQISYDKPGIVDDMYQLALKLIIVCERFDSHEEKDEFHVSRTKQEKEMDVQRRSRPSILIFLPGILEIEKMLKCFQAWQMVNDDKYLPIILHSSISREQQLAVFRTVPGHRKIILATNIAESSITVPDVKYVLDFCLTKTLWTDTASNYTTLRLHWASKSNCIQRSGRAGRVMNGRVYRLVTKEFYENQMTESSVPEMLRSPLENVVLKAKLLDMGPPQALLALAMDQPNLTDILNTILLLKESGALLQKVNGQKCDYDGDITFVGRVMAQLPINIQISKLLLFGDCFSALNECIIIAAGLNVNNIFLYPLRKELEAYSQKLNWADGSGSDLFAIYNAYKVWQTRTEQNNFGDTTEADFASRYNLNLRALNEVRILADELRQRLERIGIKERMGVHRATWNEREKSIILKIIIAGAFYPNYFVHSSSSMGVQETERTAYNAIGGLDPCNTVFYSGFDQRCIGPLYTSIIKESLACCANGKKENIKIKYDIHSEKIFATFLKNRYGNEVTGLVQSVPGRVSTSVYQAIKKRTLQSTLLLKCFNYADAEKYAKDSGLFVYKHGRYIQKPSIMIDTSMLCIPRAFTKYVDGFITHVETCSHFYLQPLKEQELLNTIKNELNDHSPDILPFKSVDEIKIGHILAAPYKRKGSEYERELPLYYRAKVLNIKFEQIMDQKIYLYRVCFIDYGHFQNYQFTQLRKLCNTTEYMITLPPRIFQCNLAEVRPSTIDSPRSFWTDETNEFFKNLVKDKPITVEIYSVVNFVAMVYVTVNNKQIHDVLIRKGIAEYAEENYMSKMNHDMRLRRQENVLHNNDEQIDDDLNAYELMEFYDSLEDMPDIVLTGDHGKLQKKITLRGPYSPLEISIEPVTNNYGLRSCSIERASVNCVLLNSDPQDYHEKLIVATHISGTQSGDLVARNTTLMPKINGFGAFMALIFCPTMELKLDDKKTRYISLLAGLGYDTDKKRPIFQEHDLFLHLDVHIAAEDLEIINQIRYSMDALLHTEVGQERPDLLEKSKIELAKKIKSLIISLLEKPRKFVEKRFDGVKVWDQARNGDNDQNDIIHTQNVFGDRAIFPLHAAPRCYSADYQEKLRLRTHCQELKRLSTLPEITGLGSQRLQCKLCDLPMQYLSELRIHLLSRLHRDRESQVFTDD